MSITRFLAPIGFALALAVSLRAEDLPLDYPQAGGWKDLQVPERVEVSLQLPARAVIGAQIPAKLMIHNRGTVGFEITIGGDYRSTGFPQRMKVRVRDANGAVMRELTPESYGMGGGGILAPRTVKPGGSESIEFPLERYVSFLKAGKYTVTTGHDLGWQKHASRAHPLGQASIEIAEPTAAQAEELVKSILAGKQTTPTAVAFQGKSYPAVREQSPVDYVTQSKLSVLRHPAYLPPLREAAKIGSIEAISGIGHIATADATEALIALLKSESPAAVTEALLQIVRRMPDKGDATKPAMFWRSGDTFQIDPLLPDSWKPEYEKSLIDEAARLLRHPVPDVVSAAALIIESCGTESVGQPLLDALQVALDAERSPPRHETAALYPPLPLSSLLIAVDTLRKRGWRSPEPGRTALMVAKFREYADDSIPKPADARWRDSMLTWVENGPPTLKEHALRAIPLPLSDAAVKAVLKALDDDNPRVLIAACQVAAKSTLKDFAPALCQLVEIEPIPNVNGAAVDAAIHCGARLDLWRVVAGNIVEKQLLVDSVRSLVVNLLDLAPGSGSSGNSNFSREERFQMREAWLAFLKKHEPTIAKGKRIPLPDSATANRLLGGKAEADQPVVSLQLRGGGRWPELKK